ncbi:DUF5615 family PIN-like protein [Halobaculum rubrum]|uniref:DUF5615 family PIN-like protein n=1 Tax=Halobaculum rubrum TaxID=2872158 RepID=UPI001CA44C70|nr:DUF5615 family PIN-like protein [Halobaculum rubrum]QZX99323.1 DUF5615 family PIN-like protein [Halobaculum rubrum]
MSVSGREWAFLVDENQEPKIAAILETEGYDAEHVQNVLGKGVKDEPDVLPYAVANDRIVITADVKDFAPLRPSEHCGVMLLDMQRTSAYDVSNAVLDIIESYRDRDQFVMEKLDAWL